jgi:hypothetical protein
VGFVQTASRPFLFKECSELREILGEEAYDEKRLVELLETVPLDSIYFHTHSYFLRHSYVERVYPNDFAQWVAMEVRDHVLGERLAVVDPFEYGELDALRGQLISIIDDHLSRTPIVPRVMFGEPFYFNHPSPDTHRGQDAPRISERTERSRSERDLFPRLRSEAPSQT